MDWEYQKYGQYFAQAAHGLEDLLVAELQELGCRKIKTAYRGVRFQATPAEMYRVVYWTRLASRILAPLLTFDCHSAQYLYRTAVSLPWEELLTPLQTFAIQATVSNSRIKHSQYAALRLKDAVVDRIRDRTGGRPNVDRKHPTLWLNVHIHNNRAVISMDAAGSALHKRGYRRRSVEAPMQETLAAAIVRLSEWKGDIPLLDPFCGSGTILAEALMSVCNYPAAILRRGFGFQHFPDFQRRAWQDIEGQARSRIRPFPEGMITGSDEDAAAIEAARKNLSILPEGDRIALGQCDFEKKQPSGPTIIIANPPYGIRLQGGSDLTPLYKRLGDWLKQSCTGCTAYLYFGERKYLKSIGLRSAWKKPLRNGGLDGRLARFDLY